jgi:uncharacterized protein YidB (DUF937 family)
MGLLDGIIGQVLGNAMGGGGQAAGQAGAGMGNPMLNLVMGMMTNQQSGGLQGLLGQLTKAGLGDQVQSWVGTGPNQAVSGDQIHQALGGDQIAAIAKQFGLDPSHVTDQLAQLLPQAVNHVTPDGQVPDHSTLQDGLGMLAQLLAKR